MTQRNASIILVGDIPNAHTFLGKLQDWLAAGIRWFQNEPGEPAIFHHAGLMFRMTKALADELTQRGYDCTQNWIGKQCVIEAHFTIRVLPWLDFIAEREQVAIAESARLSIAGSDRIIRHAIAYVGQTYSVTRLLAYLKERITGKPATLKYGPNKMVCSSLVSLPYWIELKLKFGRDSWRQVTPDDIGDRVMENVDWHFEWVKGKPGINPSGK